MRWGLRRMRVEDGGGEVWEKVEVQVGGEKQAGVGGGPKGVRKHSIILKGK